MAIRFRLRFSLLTLLLTSLLCGSGALLWVHRAPSYARLTIQDGEKIQHVGFTKDDEYFYTVAMKDPDPPSANLNAYNFKISVYSTRSGQIISTTDWQSGIPPSVTHADEKHLVTYGEKPLIKGGSEYRLWDVHTGREVNLNSTSADDFRIDYVSRAGNFALLHSRGNAVLVNLPSPVPMIEVSIEDSFRLSDFSRDEKWVGKITNDKNRSIVELVPLKTGAPVQTLCAVADRQYITGIEFSPDSRCVAVKDYAPYTTAVFDIESKKLIGTFSGEFASFSDDSNYVITSPNETNDDGLQKVTVWKIDSRSKIFEFRSRGFRGVTVADGRILSWGEQRVWDLATGKLLFSQADRACVTEFAPDGCFAYFRKALFYQVGTTDGIIVRDFPKVSLDFELQFAHKRPEYIVCFSNAPSGKTSTVEVCGYAQPGTKYNIEWFCKLSLFVVIAGVWVWSVVQPVAKT